MTSRRIKTLVLCSALFYVTSCISEQVGPSIDCPTLLVSIDQLENTQCNAANGSFILSVEGGTSPYSFETSFETNSTGLFSDLTAGTYSVSVTDVQGCTEELDVTVQNEDGVIIDEVLITGTGCGTDLGSIQIQASGGAEPYTFTLDNGAPQASNLFTNLPISEYEVKATDASGCETTQNVAVLSGVSYEGSIRSIIETNCAISGCHNGSVLPDLRTFGQIQSSSERIRVRTANGSMPRGRTLTQEQIDLIACWVNDGALDN